MMQIVVKGAKENNLKNIDVAIPIGKIIGVTGVSGSGKSTIAKQVIARYGYKNYANFFGKTVRDQLVEDEVLDVTSVDGLPPTLLIDVVNSVSNTRSTLSTVTGLQSIIRKLFSEYGQYKCKTCGHTIENDVWKLIKTTAIRPYVELKCDTKFGQRIEVLKNISKTSEEVYFDENNKQTTLKSKRKYGYIYIETGEKIDKKQCEHIYKKLGVTVKTDLKDIVGIDLLGETYCEVCKCKLKKIDMMRFSFNINYDDGGGACRECEGYGTKTTLEMQDIILDDNKAIDAGAIAFVDSKGIKYTKVSDKFIEAVGKKYGFKNSTPLMSLSEEQKHILFYGCPEVIKFTDRTGSNGGKKQEVFKGILTYLMESYKQGKGKEQLQTLIGTQICSSCKGVRVDEDFSHIYIEETSIYDVLKMSIDELMVHLEQWQAIYSESGAVRYIRELLDKLTIFHKLGCGYLTLERASITLSGGELQRLRLATFMSDHLKGMCIVLDEPSTGLHPSDIQKLIEVLYEMKHHHHTVVIVEHNKYVLEHCDYIVDLGPKGGEEGGSLLISDSITNLHKYDTYTTQFLGANKQSIQRKKKAITDVVSLEWEPHIHLKPGRCSVPLNALVTICGVSGSGKSTFVKSILEPYLQAYGEKYNVVKVQYMGQKNITKTEYSTVGTLLDINQLIAKLFAKEVTGLSASEFLLNSTKGKCPVCLGKGSISVEGEDGAEICASCEGKKFSKEVLSVKYAGYTIDDILNKSIQQLYEILDDKKLRQIITLCIEAGIGYLSLARTSKTLSKGEIQRIKLVSVIKKGTTNNVIILDEPTRGLHHQDIKSLLNIFDNIIQRGNTVITIEHNLDFISNSDWVIEFGPKAGLSGGEVVFQGTVEDATEVSTQTLSLMNGHQLENMKQCQPLIDEHALEIDQINYVTKDIKKMKDIVSYSNKLYLKAITPLKIISLQEDEVAGIDMSQLRLMVDVDVDKPKLPQQYTLLEVLNLKSDIALMYANKLENERAIGKYVFYYRNHLGKCRACHGTGSTLSIDQALIFETNGDINTNVMKMLKKQTNYIVAQKELKKEYGIDIAKRLEEMNEEEKILLIYGDKNKSVLVKGKKYYWEGVYNAIKKYGEKHLPKEVYDQIKESWHKEYCSFCGGKLLNDKYAKVKANGLTYGELLHKPLDSIQKESEELPDRIKEACRWMQKLDLGYFSLNDSMGNKTEREIALIKLISMYINNIYGMIIVVFNYDKLIRGDQDKVRIIELLDAISSRNMIISI